MHRGLFFFGFFLVLLSVALGFYPIAILGLIFVVASFFSGQAKSKPVPTTTTPTTPAAPSRPTPTRISQKRSAPARKPTAEIPSAIEQTTPALTEVMPQYVQPAPKLAPQVATSSVMLPPLFPMPMFPTLSQPPPQVKQEELRGEHREERDELVEAIAALAILRILNQRT